MTAAGLVLMGGRATRMGGGDKALIEIAGRPILEHALDRLRPQVGAVALSANGDPARFAAFGAPVLPDPEGAPDGPLGGIIAGLRWASTISGVTHLATIPGDGPCPPDDLVARLFSAGGGPAAATGPNGIEPLHALWPVAMLPGVVAMTRQGVRGPKRALEVMGATLVAFDDPNAFLDLDEPGDLERLRAALETGR